MNDLVKNAEQVLNDYYHNRKGWEWVQYQDFVPEDQLKGKVWAEECFDRWPGEFFSRMTDRGLVPIGGQERPNTYYCVQDFSRMSPLRAVWGIAQLVNWNQRTSEIEQARKYAATVFELHQNGEHGFYYGVDAFTGSPCADTHNVTGTGNLVAGLQILGLHDLAQKAVQITANGLDLIPERYTAYGPILKDWSSDGVYLIREMVPAEKQRWAEIYSERYYKPQWGHSTTHADGDSWYGDGIVNQLIMHVEATRLDRFDACYRTIQRESINGLCPSRITRGKGDGQPHKSQELLLEALVARALKTELASDIAEACRFAVLLSDGGVQKPEVFARHVLRLSEYL